MYQDQVETLTLEQIPLIFKDEGGSIIPKNGLVIDFAHPLANSGSPFLPDMGICGYFQKVNKNSHNEFIIMEEGPHVLFITGVTKGQTEKFKFKNSISTMYWQDTDTGYLFQILDINKKETKFIHKKLKQTYEN